MGYDIMARKGRNKMIKNIVFDLGNVLVEFKPIDYLLRIGFKPKEAEILSKIVFLNPMWNEFDRGTITIEQYSEKLKKENPQYIKEIEKIFDSDWLVNMFIEDKEMSKFLEEMSHKYNIYVLSNISEYVLNYVKNFGFWNYVTGGTFSYQVKACKPEKEIYEAFLNQNNVIPQECLFIDDKAENIEMAKEIGINGIVFKNNLQEINKIL